MIIPERLKPGDAVGIAAVSSPPDLNHLQRGIKVLEAMGLQVRLGSHVGNIHGFLAGTDEERLADFHDMMENREIKAVFFACGGYGSGRIAPLLDYRVIRKHPKILWGYSDLTYLFTAIRQATGLVCFHGPMPASDLGKPPGADPVTLEGFRQLFQPLTRVYQDAGQDGLEVLSGGHAEGELVGGNLTVLTSTLGTPFEIDAKNKLLLIEDVNEEPYRVDSMLQQLTYAGKFAEAAGIVVGDFSNALPKGTRPSFSLEDVLLDYFGSMPVPVVKGFKIGHCQPHFAVPLGVPAVLSAAKKCLVVKPGVC